MLDDDQRAWNNFVMLSDPTIANTDDEKRAAAIANLFMGAANNGGINSFLTCTHEFAGMEVHSALERVGAKIAAAQLGRILEGLGQPLPACSQSERWDTLELLWPEAWDDDAEIDVPSPDADEELMEVLSRHVLENKAHYLAIA